MHRLNISCVCRPIIFHLNLTLSLSLKTSTLAEYVIEMYRRPIFITFCRTSDSILSEDEWGDLECRYKACQAAITDGGLFTDTA